MGMFSAFEAAIEEFVKGIISPLSQRVEALEEQGMRSVDPMASGSALSDEQRNAIVSLIENEVENAMSGLDIERPVESATESYLENIDFSDIVRENLPYELANFDADEFANADSVEQSIEDAINNLRDELSGIDPDTISALEERISAIEEAIRGFSV